MNRESWLNGWHRTSGVVMLGSSVHCAGCGASKGITCVVMSEDSVAPEKIPDWPFNEDDCPVCGRLAEPIDRLTERLVAMRSRRR